MQTREKKQFSEFQPILVLVLMMVVCTGIISCVFLKAVNLSQRSKLHDAVVQICRNQAEEYRAGKIDGNDTALCLNENYEIVDYESAAYYVTINESVEQYEDGQMKTGIITVTDKDGIEDFSLTVKRYQSNGGS